MALLGLRLANLKRAVYFRPKRAYWRAGRGLWLIDAESSLDRVRFPKRAVISIVAVCGCL